MAQAAQSSDARTLIPPTEFVPIEAAGTLDQPNLATSEALLTQPTSHGSDAAENTPSGHGEEQALESHEVVELQAFGERKDWIVAKTKVRSIHSFYISWAQRLRSFWRACLR